MPPDTAATAPVSANIQLARALGVEVTGLRKLVLTLQPKAPPLIEATYRIDEANGQLAEVVHRLELVCGPAETTKTEPGDAAAAA